MAPSATSTEFTPRPFPKNVPIIPLPRISLAKLRSKDNDEIERLWDACKDWGFFYLDLQTSQEGKDLILESEAIHQAGVDFFTNHSVADKSKFKTHHGHLDTGYKSTLLDDEGNAKNLEFINVSHNGLFNSQSGYELTPPLNPYKHVFMEFMKSGHSIACLILNCLEGKLKLPIGTLDQLHGLSDSSGDFLRILRYPAPKEGAPTTKVIGSAHTDAMSVAILFNWQGGLQLSCVNEDGRVPLFFDEGREPEDSWFYVEPIPGHAICNLGDAMKVFSNGLLKSGKHRVVTPPGDQGTFDRYSVLLATRPADNTIMRAMKSSEIPAYDGDDEKEGLTAKEWGMIKVQHLLKLAAAAHQKKN